MNIKKIAIVGAPNVGKSSIFNNLSGSYATVSNYPGTTVEVFRARTRLAGQEWEIIDTPGMYSFLPLSEEEKVARELLFHEHPDVVLHVVAAGDIERLLILTLQLIEAGLPVVLVVNILDEASKEGIHIDIKKLEHLLGIPVIGTISVNNKGTKALKEKILNIQDARSKIKVQYPERIEHAIEVLGAYVKDDEVFSKRTICQLALQADSEITAFVKNKGMDLEVVDRLKKEIGTQLNQPLEYLINMSFNQKAHEIASQAITADKKKSHSLTTALSDITLKPVFGVPLLFLFIYFGLYKFVGQFGAGIVVNFLESIFTRFINPVATAFVTHFVKFSWLTNLFVGDYGIITLGLRYAIAIVLPVVGIFFFVFSFAEDTGYLPRMGAMLDGVFKKIGLSGRAVIPMVLGLGCDTMATMVTRVLPTKRERIIATVLLSLAIPCSAQLGVIMSVLSSSGFALSVWFVTISFVFAITGFLLNKMLKGARPSFYIELPPLRLPRLSNIFVKTLSRLGWYCKEVIPLFIWASVIIWAGQLTKIFDLIVHGLTYPLRVIGLPVALSPVFLFGFFRRDYGAAGLYDLNKQGALSVREAIVTAVILTLFLPCIAQFMVNIKERGAKMAFGIAAFIVVFSFTVGLILNKVLLYVGVV